MPLEFFVPGKPQAQGSKVKTRWSMREDNKELGPWRERVALAAFAAIGKDGRDENGKMVMIDGPIAAILEFVLYRPTSTPKTKPTPPATKKPDIDKMIRAVLDALTHVVWTDDSQVVALMASKRVAEVGESPGVHVWLDRVNT